MALCHNCLRTMSTTLKHPNLSKATRERIDSRDKLRSASDRVDSCWGPGLDLTKPKTFNKTNTDYTNSDPILFRNIPNTHSDGLSEGECMLIDLHYRIYQHLRDNRENIPTKMQLFLIEVRKDIALAYNKINKTEDNTPMMI